MTDNVQTPAVTLSFPYRRASAGGRDDTILISLATKKPLPSLLKGSGRHGTREYKLLPGRYLEYEVWRSNTGNMYCIVSMITVGQDGVKTEDVWKVYDHITSQPLETLPQEIMDILVANREDLPLFREVFPSEGE